MRMDMWQPDQIGMVELYGNKKVNEVVVAAAVFRSCFHAAGCVCSIQLILVPTADV